ncbi:MAG: hypothetical protein ACYCW6_25885 [Candidatus Xenobia bacterium]
MPSIAQQLQIVTGDDWRPVDVLFHLHLMLDDVARWTRQIEALRPPPGESGESRERALCGLQAYASAIERLEAALWDGTIATVAPTAIALAEAAEEFLLETLHQVEDATEALLDAA